MLHAFGCKTVLICPSAKTSQKHHDLFRCFLFKCFQLNNESQRLMMHLLIKTNSIHLHSWMLCIILPPSFFFFAFHCIPTIKYKTSDSLANKGLHSCYFATSTLWAPSKAYWSYSLSIDFKRLWIDSFFKLYLNLWRIFKAENSLMHWRFCSLL